MSGEVEYGRCDICGNKASLKRKYYHYNVDCECHRSIDDNGENKHFEIVRHCKDCKPLPPKETKVSISNEKYLI